MPSAANTATPETGKTSQAGSPPKRANPVALEVLVSVTGAKSNDGGARELFTEETQTVLVFADGAVIRLMSPVALGQLLFLTNKRSSTEVVCQVLNTRASGPAGSYVEVQFTEGKTDFWGASFTEGEKSAPEFSRKEHVEAQETTQTVPATVVQPHKAEDVDRLKQEVEGLRRQLWELEKKRIEESTKTDTTAAEEITKLMAVFAPAQGAGQNASSKRETAAGSGAGGEAPLMPAAGPRKEPARAVVRMSLPMGKKPSEPQGTPAVRSVKDGSEDLLPKPELDFSQMPVEMVNGVRSAYRARRAEFRKVTTPAFVVLAVVLGFALWTMKPWRYLGGLKAAIHASVVAKAGKPSATVNKPFNAQGNSASTGVAENTSRVGNATNSSDKTKGTTETADPKPTAETATPDATGAQGSGNTVLEKNVAEEPKKIGRGRGKHARAEELSIATKNGNAGVLAVNDAPVLPAKLVKAVNPLYPPDAMRGFITGDVRAELVVEADGRIGEIKVLSGPKPLREAAVEALRQYQYAPATQGGKGVVSKVTTTVKFWFNP